MGSSVLLNYVSSPQPSSQSSQERRHKHSELHLKHKLTPCLQATTTSTKQLLFFALNKVCVTLALLIQHCFGQQNELAVAETLGFLDAYIPAAMMTNKLTGKNVLWYLGHRAFSSSLYCFKI